MAHQVAALQQVVRAAAGSTTAGTAVSTALVEALKRSRLRGLPAVQAAVRLVADPVQQFSAEERMGLCTTLTRSLLFQHNLRDAIQVPGVMEAEGLPPAAAVLRALLRWRGPDQPASPTAVLAAARAAKLEHGMRLPFSAFRMLVDQLASVDSGSAGTTASSVVPLLSEVLRDWPYRPLGPWEANHALAIIARHDLHVALQEFDRLVADGMLPNADTFNVLISAAARAVQDDSLAFYLFSQMQDKYRLSPNAITFTTLMRLAAARDDIDCVLTLFDIAKQQGIRPDAVMMSQLLNTAARSRRADLGAHLLQQMKKSSIVADKGLYIAVLNMCGRCDLPQQATKLFDMALRDCGQDFDIYLAYMRACVECGAQTAATQAFAKLKESGIPFDERAIMAVLGQLRWRMSRDAAQRRQ